MKNIIFILLLTFCSTSISYAQWQADVRLTNSIVSSNLYSNNSRCISTDGNTVHIVWWENREGNDEIYYKRSIDAGISWGQDIRLTNDPAISFYPSIGVSGSTVYIIWKDYRTGIGIYFKRSTDAGINWSEDTRINMGSAGLLNSSTIAVSGQNLHIVWEDSRDTNIEVYYKRSTDGGLSWGYDMRLTNASGYSESPSISVSGQTTSVVWYDNRNGNADIYYKCSTNGGVSWEADTRLTNNQYEQWSPSIAVSGSINHVVWADYRYYRPEIFYKLSTDNGVNWGADIRLTQNDSVSQSPSIAVSGSNVHVVWTDYRDGNFEIYYKRSTDEGINWEADTRLTNNFAASYNSCISISGSTVHVVWEDERDGNPEIYYKRNPTGNPSEIKNINTEIPDKFKLEQNHPNPFNPSTIIKFMIAGNGKSKTENGLVTLKVYDILGKEIATLVNERLQPGTYEIPFSINQFPNYQLPSGVYFYQLRADNFVETKKMILMK